MKITSFTGIDLDSVNTDSDLVWIDFDKDPNSADGVWMRARPIIGWERYAPVPNGTPSYSTFSYNTRTQEWADLNYSGDCAESLLLTIYEYCGCVN